MDKEASFQYSQDTNKRSFCSAHAATGSPQPFIVMTSNSTEVEGVDVGLACKVSVIF
jgi:hypothetical protein